MLAIWPFDWSCSGFVFVALVALVWFAWAAASAARQVIQSDTAKDVGKSMLEGWFQSWFIE